MLQALKIVEEEANDANGDIKNLIGSLEQYNMVENVVALSHQEAVNKKGGGRGYSRV